MTAEDAKAVAETIALGCAAVFFIYKAVSGYFYVDMCLTVSLKRSRGIEDSDVLVITAALKKGNRGSVRINDAQAKVAHKGGVQIVPLVGFYRLSYSTERVNEVERKVVNWAKLSSKPLLRLPPNEKATFSCFVEVPRTATCTIEVAVLGRERSWFRLGQWKASNISVPITETA